MDESKQSNAPTTYNKNRINVLPTIIYNLKTVIIFASKSLNRKKKCCNENEKYDGCRGEAVGKSE